MPTNRSANALARGGPDRDFDHCDGIAKQYGLHDDTLFHTQVTDLEWDAGRCRWIVRTNRGDEFTAQFVGMGTGPLHVAKPMTRGLPMQ